MAYTKAHLDAVERAIARGEKIVRYSDRTVEYRTVGGRVGLQLYYPHFPVA